MIGSPPDDPKVTRFVPLSEIKKREADARKADRYIKRDGTAPTPEEQEAKISRLVAMDHLEYDRARRETAEELGVSIAALDKERAERRKRTASGRITERDYWKVESWPEPVDGGALVEDITRCIKRYVMVEDDGALATALWVTFTWAHDIAVHSPILLVQSPEANCGKSTLLGLINLMVPRGAILVDTSPAVIYRMISAWQPTLILDEAEGEFRSNPELRAVINSGWTRGAGVPRCNPETNEPEFFETFGPKAIGLKGARLPDTTLSRSIVVQMQRKLPADKVDDFSHRDDDELAGIRRRLKRFAQDNLDKIENHRPRPPEGFTNRLAANWRTMLAIAEICGMGSEARSAAVELSRRDDEASFAVELLKDIKDTFERLRLDRISSVQLVKELGNMEDRPWAEMPRTLKVITQLQLASLLKPFEVKPKQVRFGEVTLKVYTMAMFERAFRYIPLAGFPQNTRNTETTAETKGPENSQCFGVSGTAGVSAQECVCAHCGGTAESDNPVNQTVTPDGESLIPVHRHCSEEWIRGQLDG